MPKILSAKAKRDIQAEAEEIAKQPHSEPYMLVLPGDVLSLLHENRLLSLALDEMLQDTEGNTVYLTGKNGTRLSPREHYLKEASK